MSVLFSKTKQILFFTSLWFGYIESAENIALGKQAYQSSTIWDGFPSKAVDGGLSQIFNSSGSCSHTDKEASAYWEVDLGEVFFIDHVTIYNRIYELIEESDRLRDVELYLGVDKGHYQLNGFHPGVMGPIYTFHLELPVSGRWVRITRLASVNDFLTLCEVQVYEYPCTFHYFRMTSNMTGDGTITQALRAKSPIHCSFLCLQASDCVAANYLENSSQCYLLSLVSSQTPADGNVLIS